MIEFFYGCSEKKENVFPIKKFSLKEITSLVGEGSIPETIVIEGKNWVRILDVCSLFYKESDPTIAVAVKNLEYFSEMGELPLKEVWINGEKFLFSQVIEGIPQIADFSDVIRRVHDDSYKVKFTKPPLECEKGWGYGIT